MYVGRRKDWILRKEEEEEEWAMLEICEIGILFITFVMLICICICMYFSMLRKVNKFVLVTLGPVLFYIRPLVFLLVKK